MLVNVIVCAVRTGGLGMRLTCVASSVSLPVGVTIPSAAMISPLANVGAVFDSAPFTQ